MVKLVVFVPGFMGSSLLYRGPGPLKNQIEVPAWGQELSQTQRNLRYLAFPTPPAATVEATAVIDHASLYGLPFLGGDVYGILIRHLRGLAFKEKIEFVEFPYDWRASVQTSAAALRTRVTTAAAGLKAGQILIVAHSMGGLVARLALLESEELQRKTQRLVHIASPLRGSVKAMWTLKVAPAMSSGFDGLLRGLLGTVDVVRAVQGQALLFDQMMQVIRSFPSIYELLPPQDVKPLKDETGERLSCFTDDLWPEADLPLVHTRWRRTPSLRRPRRCLFR